MVMRYATVTIHGKTLSVLQCPICTISTSFVYHPKNEGGSACVNCNTPIRQWLDDDYEHGLRESLKKTRDEWVVDESPKWMSECKHSISLDEHCAECDEEFR